MKEVVDVDVELVMGELLKYCPVRERAVPKTTSTRESRKSSFKVFLNVTVTVSLFRGYITLEKRGESPSSVPYHPSSKYSP